MALLARRVGLVARRAEEQAGRVHQLADGEDRHQHRDAVQPYRRRREEPPGPVPLAADDCWLRDSGPTYVISNLCTTMMLDKPVFRDTLIKRLRESSTPGERG